MKKAALKAKQGLQLIRTAINELLAANSAGMTNYQVAQELGLEVSFGGSHKNYLTFSVLQLMVQEGDLTTEKVGRNRLFFGK